MRSAFLSPPDLNPIIPFVERHGALIYEGGGQERIFYTPSLFSKEILTHLHFRKEQQRQEWYEIASLRDLPCPLIASVRLFLFEDDDAEEISSDIHEKTSLCAPLMKDVFRESVHIIQVTATGASKGQALQALRREHPSLLSIAAGDDMNDLDMLRAADFGIAMPYAPLHLREMAHAIAPSFGEDPLIEPLERAMKRMQEGEERR
jgi:HAD superfamily hydrolase (TIGR01484 family)